MTEGVAVFRDVSEVLQGELTNRDAGDLYGRTVSLSLPWELQGCESKSCIQ